MVEKSTFRQPKFVDDGSVDWRPVKSAFTEIQDVLNEHARELKALAQHGTFTISMMFQTQGKHVLLRGGKHLRLKPVNAFAVVHDNVPQEIQVTIVGFSHPAKFSDTEKKGSAKMLDILSNKVLHFKDSVEVELSTSRRITVYATFASIEEE